MFLVKIDSENLRCLTDLEDMLKYVREKAVEQNRLEAYKKEFEI